MYEKERQELVDKISKNGITDVYVLKAISEVERHKFVPVRSTTCRKCLVRNTARAQREASLSITCS